MTHHLLRHTRAHVGGLVLAALTLGATAGAAQDPGGPASHPPARLRAADAKAAALLAAGMARSTTFRELVQTIEHSDLVVYVDTRSFLKIPGQLQLLAATPGCRHLRVSIRTPGLDNDLVAWLAHELTHAVEVATAPEVRDQAGLRRLYQRIGRAGRYGDNAESGAAQEIWTKVLGEMRAAR
jgi:hypothetical protein